MLEETGFHVLSSVDWENFYTMFLGLASIILLTVISLVTAPLDYFSRNKRVKYVLIFLILTLGGLSIVMYVRDHSDRVQNEKNLRDDLDAIKAQNADLSSKLDPFLNLAKNRFPNQTDASALRKLLEDMTNLKTTTQALKNRITLLTAKVHIVFSGEWVEGFVKNQRVLSPPKEAYLILSGTGQPKTIKFYPSRIASINEGHGMYGIVYDVAIEPGDYPLGESIDSLKDYIKCELAFPFLKKDVTKNGLATLARLEIIFHVNGKEQFSLIYKFNKTFQLPNEPQFHGFTFSKNVFAQHLKTKEVID